MQEFVPVAVEEDPVDKDPQLLDYEPEFAKKLRKVVEGTEAKTPLTSSLPTEFR